MTRTRPISKNKAAELISRAYPVWSASEVDAAVNRTDLDIDIGRGQKITPYPSAGGTVRALALTYTGR
jgi:hypothetical protein